MNDTYGPLFYGWSPSAGLQSFLESRLPQMMAGIGSPLYELTWKRWNMRSGPPICALRASARTISASDSSGPLSGWATCTVNDATGSMYAYSGGNHDKVVFKLPGMAHLTNWMGGATNPPLAGIALCSGLAEMVRFVPSLHERINLRGAVSGIPPTWMRLNPLFSLCFLMGYPLSWGLCGMKGMLNSKKR
ncbi:MAG: hypothetical protein KatS3mg051_1706 [Anaerolineae bacterium]|nr:MAG: hypothetical protein KatS3mg051_1706 [Anaerolineae bacterium]